MDEHDWVAHVRRRFGDSHAVADHGIGDDAAVLTREADGRVVSVDVAVEGVHFDRRWAPPDALARRAYVASLSDLAAMGAQPVAGFFSVVARPDEEADWLRGAIDGVARAADEFSAPILGGNFANGAVTVWNFTVVGALEAEPVLRGGARVGDGVFVSGPVGGAALGWRVLEAGGPSTAHETRAVECWLRPRPRFDLVGRLARQATAAVDVSDGLGQDLAHIARQSGVSIELEAERIPTFEGFEAAARAYGLDPLKLSLGGGEDYEIAFTAPWACDPGRRIGRVTERGDEDVTLLDAEGRPLVLPKGHRHLES